MSDDLDILSWLDKTESVKPALEVGSTVTDSLTAPDITGTCFEIQREVLLSILERAISIVPTRDIVPVLTNFQFKVSENNLEVVSSNEKLSIVSSTKQINTKTAGVEVFPARAILNIVKESNAGSTIYIEVTGKSAVIVAEGFSAEIALASAKGFPVMDSVDDVLFHEVNRLAFLEAVNTVKYALPNRDFSGQSSMKMISIKNGKFTACDGSRFQQVRIEDFNLSMKLSAFSIAPLVKLLSSTDMESIDVGETASGKLVFKLGNVLFYSNKLSDPYPNVEQLWLRPALSNDQELVVDKQELVTAIKQIRFALDNDSPTVGLIIDGNQLTITARGTNESRNAVIGCKWAGKKRTIAVNCYQLAEMLKAYTKAECRFLLGEDTKLRKSPILLKDDDTLAIATISQALSYRAGLES